LTGSGKCFIAENCGQEVASAAVSTGQERDPLLQAPHGQLPQHGELSIQAP